MADTSADAPRTYPTHRAADGKFHGLHGLERAARTGKLITAEGAMDCPTCGAKVHPGAVRCPKGHRVMAKRAMAEAARERRVQEAIRVPHVHLRGRGGLPVDFKDTLHPRDPHGRFRDTGREKPKVGSLHPLGSLAVGTEVAHPDTGKGFTITQHAGGTGARALTYLTPHDPGPDKVALAAERYHVAAGDYRASRDVWSDRGPVLAAASPAEKGAAGVLYHPEDAGMASPADGGMGGSGARTPGWTTRGGLWHLSTDGRYVGAVMPSRDVKGEWTAYHAEHGEVGGFRTLGSAKHWLARRDAAGPEPAEGGLFSPEDLAAPEPSPAAEAAPALSLEPVETTERPHPQTTFQRTLSPAHEQAFKLRRAVRDAEFNRMQRVEQIRHDAHVANPTEDLAPDAITTDAEYLRLDAEAQSAQLALAAAEGVVGGRVFRIPREVRETLDKRIAKLAKSATKVGVAPPTATKVGSEWREHRKSQSIPEGHGERAYFDYVVVKGEEPKIAGWSFMATLQHIDGVNVIRRMPGRDEGISLDRFRSGAAICDYCHLDRKRKDTYLVREDATGDLKQVGSNCIRDFLGQGDPTAIAGFLEAWSKLDTEFGGDWDDEDDGEPRGRRVPLAVPTDAYLAHVALMIRTEGWKARSSGAPDPTASAASMNYFNWVRGVKARDGTPMWIEPTEQDFAIGKAALAWARDELPKRDTGRGLSEFDHNMIAMTRGDVVPERGEGILAYVVVAHAKAIARDIEKARVAKVGENSQHVGTVGERKDMRLTVERVNAHEGNYGVTYITKLADEQGNIYKWFASRELEPGVTYQGKFTIKSHGEYQGVKETQITRPSALEKYEPGAPPPPSTSKPTRIGGRAVVLGEGGHGQLGEIEKVRGGFQPHMADYALPTDPVFDKWGDAIMFLHREHPKRHRNAVLSKGLPSGVTVKHGSDVQAGDMVGLVVRTSFIRERSAWSVASPPQDNELPIAFLPAEPTPVEPRHGDHRYFQITAPDGVVIPVPGNPVVVEVPQTPMERRVEAEIARIEPDAGEMGSPVDANAPSDQPRPDTPAQTRILRQSKIARKVRAMYPAGTRVTSAEHDTGVDGTVVRHVPGLTAQGGYLVVKWDSGHTGRVSPITLRRVESDAGEMASPAEGAAPRVKLSKTQAYRREQHRYIVRADDGVPDLPRMEGGNGTVLGYVVAMETAHRAPLWSIHARGGTRPLAGGFATRQEAVDALVRRSDVGGMASPAEPGGAARLAALSDEQIAQAAAGARGSGSGWQEREAQAVAALAGVSPELARVEIDLRGYQAHLARKQAQLAAEAPPPVIVPTPPPGTRLGPVELDALAQRLRTADSVLSENPEAHIRPFMMAAERQGIPANDAFAAYARRAELDYEGAQRALAAANARAMRTSEGTRKILTDEAQAAAEHIADLQGKKDALLAAEPAAPALARGARNPAMTGRHVPIRGTKVNVPRDPEWERVFADGVRFHSPAGTTDVYRNGELVSAPGSPITHPEMKRSKPEGVTTTVVRSGAIATDERYTGAGQIRPTTPEEPIVTPPVYQTIKVNVEGDGLRPLQVIDRDSQQHATVTADTRNEMETDPRFVWRVRVKPGTEAPTAPTPFNPSLDERVAHGAGFAPAPAPTAPTPEPARTGPRFVVRNATGHMASSMVNRSAYGARTPWQVHDTHTNAILDEYASKRAAEMDVRDRNAAEREAAKAARAVSAPAPSPAPAPPVFVRAPDVKLSRVAPGHYASDDGKWAVISDRMSRSTGSESGLDRFGNAVEGDTGEWAVLYDKGGGLRDSHEVGENLDWYPTKREAVAALQDHVNRQQIKDHNAAIRARAATPAPEQSRFIIHSQGARAMNDPRYHVQERNGGLTVAKLATRAEAEAWIAKALDPAQTPPQGYAVHPPRDDGGSFALWGPGGVIGAFPSRAEAVRGAHEHKAGLSPAPAPAPAGLVWDDRNPRAPSATDASGTPIGRISPMGNDRFVVHSFAARKYLGPEGTDAAHVYPTVEDAKAALQAEHEGRAVPVPLAPHHTPEGRRTSRTFTAFGVTRTSMTDYSHASKDANGAVRFHTSREAARRRAGSGQVMPVEEVARRAYERRPVTHSTDPNFKRTWRRVNTPDGTAYESGRYRITSRVDDTSGVVGPTTYWTVHLDGQAVTQETSFASAKAFVARDSAATPAPAPAAPKPLSAYPVPGETGAEATRRLARAAATPASSGEPNRYAAARAHAMLPALARIEAVKAMSDDELTTLGNRLIGLGTTGANAKVEVDREKLRRNAPGLAARREAATERAARVAAVDATTAIPEPTEPTAPGSLAGVDLTGVHPKAIDTELARISGEMGKYQGYAAGILNTLERDRARDRQRGAQPRELDARMQSMLDGYRAKIAEYAAEAAPLNEEFSRRGGWSRFFLVTNGNGHVHNRLNCPTTYPTTEYRWLVDLAAKTEQAMVEQWGEKACSVCFPSAPSMYEAMRASGRTSEFARRTQAEVEARRALKAEREAAKAAKAITNPDGSELRLSGRYGERIGSLVTAKRALTDAIITAARSRQAQGNGSMLGSPEYLAEHEANVELLIAAIAAKTGVDPAALRVEYEAKALAKRAREGY